MCVPIYPIDAVLFASVLLPLAIFFYFYLTTPPKPWKPKRLLQVSLGLVLYIIIINIAIYFIWDYLLSLPSYFIEFC